VVLLIKDDDFKSLKIFGSNYFKNSFLKPIKVEKKIHYNKNYLQIARFADGSGVFGLDISESCRVVILGATRSGKTFFVRSIADRIKKINEDVVYLTDVKNEYVSSSKPVQEKFADGLLEGEKPTPTPVVVLRPTFFKQLGDFLPKQNHWYSVDARKLSRADFFTLLNAEEMTPTQRISIELVYQAFQRRVAENKDLIVDYNFLISLIDEIEELEDRQKRLLSFKLKPLEESHFFEYEHKKSLVKILKKGYVPAINLDSFGRGSFSYPEVLLNIAVREVIFARRKKKINRVWIVVDEASRFIGNSKKTSIKDTIIESHDLDTRYGINYFTIFQSLTDVPERVLQQSRYIFIPQTADVSSIKDALINTGLVRNIQRSVNKAIELKKALRKIKYSWVILDRFTSSINLVVPLPPLSFHLESTR